MIILHDYILDPLNLTSTQLTINKQQIRRLFRQKLQLSY